MERGFSARPGGSGTLFVVGVPIGHQDDITIRALRVLGEADLVASEDPVATGLLFTQHGIDTPVTSYGPAHVKEKIAVLLDRLQRGARIAIVSDCGSPVISDPGCLLISAAHRRGIQVVSVPGPSAVTAAVAASGLSGDSFYFQGRLPPTKAALKRCLGQLLNRTDTVVAFCPAASLQAALAIIDASAPRRTVVLACDLTRTTETIIRGTARQVRETVRQASTIGETTLILAPARR